MVIDFHHWSSPDGEAAARSRSFRMGRVRWRRGPAPRGVRQGQGTRRRTRRLPVGMGLHLAEPVHAARGWRRFGWNAARQGRDLGGWFGGPARKPPSDPGRPQAARVELSHVSHNLYYVNSWNCPVRTSPHMSASRQFLWNAGNSLERPPPFFGVQQSFCKTGNSPAAVKDQVASRGIRDVAKPSLELAMPPPDGGRWAAQPRPVGAART